MMREREEKKHKLGRNGGENRHMKEKKSWEETAIVENGAGKAPSKGRREKENKKYEEEREETKEWRRSLFIVGSTPGHTLNGEKKIIKIIFLFLSLCVFPFPSCFDFYLDYLLGWCFNLPVSWDSFSSHSWFLSILIILSPPLLFALFFLSSKKEKNTRRKKWTWDEINVKIQWIQ